MKGNTIKNAVHYTTLYLTIQLYLWNVQTIADLNAHHHRHSRVDADSKTCAGFGLRFLRLSNPLGRVLLSVSPEDEVGPKGFR